MTEACDLVWYTHSEQKRANLFEVQVVQLFEEPGLLVFGELRKQVWHADHHARSSEGDFQGYL
jgi:hypothetical protein